LKELRDALKNMKNGRCPDDKGLMCEMFKHAPDEFLNIMLGMFNDILISGQMPGSWRETLFSMLPKTGDRTKVQNWRPIAILRISYKLFARLLYHRLRPVLDAQQSADQVGFRAEMSAEDAFSVFESVCGKSLEWGCDLWCMSCDLSKAFDRLEFPALFAALREQGVSEGYLKVLAGMYSRQTGRLRKSFNFPIERGVQQGDVRPKPFVVQCWPGSCAEEIQDQGRGMRRGHRLRRALDKHALRRRPHGLCQLCSRALSDDGGVDGRVG
jgi:hypothetical protein